MGRGGARPNAGRRPKTTAPTRQRPAMGADDLQRMMEVLKRQSGKAVRSSENSPFRLPEFPKHAIPKSGGMAQDQALTGAIAWANEGWIGGSVFDGIASDGLMFPGYAFLSQLAQRPEYRLMSEIIATEATRKWIRFKSTGEDEKDKGEKDDKDGPDKDDGEERDDLAGDRDLDDAAIERAVSQLMGDKPGASSAGEKSDKPNGKGGKKGTENEKQKKITELTDFLDNELKVRKWFMEVCLHDGFFGRGHLFLDGGKDSEGPERATPIGNGRDATTLGKVTKGWLKSIRTIEPVWVYPQVYNAQDPLAPNWYNPQQWYVMGQELHSTRLLKFVAREVPDILKPAYAFGGLSMSQMASPYIDMWLQTSRSVNQLIHSFSVMVLKTDLSSMTEPGGAGEMITRLALFNQFRDNGSTYVLDEKTEDFANVSASLAGLHELQAQAQEHMAFIGRYPLLKFTGIQPSGLNASSEGELRTFYDNVHAYQEWLIRPGLQTVVDIAMITLWGAIDRDIVFEFVPLWGMSEKEEQEVRKMDAETDQIRVDSGIVSPEEVRKKVVADPASPYQGLDPDDVPDLAAEEMAGLVPGKGGGEVTKELVGGGAGPGGPAKPGGGPAPAPKGKEPGGADSAVLPFAQDVIDADVQEEDGEWIVYLRGRRFEGFPSHASAVAWLDHLDFGMDAWEESEHPRDAKGQFGAGGEMARTLKTAAPALAHFKHLEPRGATWSKGRERPAREHYEIMASTHQGNAMGANTPNPITIPGHEAATGIALKVNPKTKHIHFSELNSHIKGAGKAMVEAILQKYPDYKFSVTDWSSGGKEGQTFWQKMMGKYPKQFAEDQAHDAEWEESKHPRDDDGKFGSGGGSAGEATKAEGRGETSTASPPDEPEEKPEPEPAQTEPNESEQPVFKTKKEHAAHLLEKGTTAAELMTTLGWPSISVPAMAKSIGMKLEKVKKGKTTTYIGTPMTAAERQAANLPPEGVKRSGGPASRDPATFSLLEFIASKGGIDPKDALIEDVRSMIGSKNKFVPGFGSLIRPGGLRLDKLREAAVESNYIHDIGFRSAAQATSTIETLFAAVDDELRGKRVYQLGQEPEHVASEKEQATREDSRRYIEKEIDAALQDADVDPASLSEKQRSRVIEIMEREGISDPLEAIEREAMEWVTDASEQGQAERILDDIEGWDVPADAGAAPKSSSTAAPF